MATRFAMAVGLCAGLALTARAQDAAPNLWPPERIQAALAAIELLHTQGLMTDDLYQRKRAMLEARRAGTFAGTALATKDMGEVNFIQNGGFEEINANSEANRSRWLWWGGWSWGGDYENFWATGENVHSGQYAAGIRCTGQPGRIGIMTPPLPIIPGATEYVFTVWAKGEGENELFLNFESGATGTLRQKIGPEWEQVTLTGQPDQGAETFELYIYVTGLGTIYLDDAKLVPVGGDLDE